MTTIFFRDLSGFVSIHLLVFQCFMGDVTSFVTSPNYFYRVEQEEVIRSKTSSHPFIRVYLVPEDLFSTQCLHTHPLLTFDRTTTSYRCPSYLMIHLSSSLPLRVDFSTRFVTRCPRTLSNEGHVSGRQVLTVSYHYTEPLGTDSYFTFSGTDWRSYSLGSLCVISIGFSIISLQWILLPYPLWSEVIGCLFVVSTDKCLVLPRLS